MTTRTIDRPGMPPACTACSTEGGHIRFNTYLPQYRTWGWLCSRDLRLYGSPESSMTEKVRFSR